MVGNKVEAVRSLFSLELKDSDLAFLFLGYSGILLRFEDLTVAIDPGKSLTREEVVAITHLDLLLFTHNHWDHFKRDYALEIIQQTETHVVADIVSSEELKAIVPPHRLTKADPRTKDATYHIGETAVTSLEGIHAGPIAQYLIDLGRIKVFHGGDSGYWRLKDTSADLAFVPVGTAKTCAPATALATIMDLYPKIAVPIHGRRQEMKHFRSIMERVLPEVEVIIADKFKPIRVSTWSSSDKTS